MAFALVAAGVMLFFLPHAPEKTGSSEGSLQTEASHLNHRQDRGPVWTRHRPASVDARGRFAADRLAAATSVESEPLEGLRGVLQDKSSSSADRVFACQKLALIGSSEAMQVLFEAITAESDLGTKREMCDSLDLLTNEEGIVALVSVAVATDELLLIQAVEDCLSRCSTRETVMYLTELHGEFHRDPLIAARLCSLLESVHGPQAMTALAGLLCAESPTDLFRAASIALAKSPGKDAARELVNATMRPLSDEQKEALRDAISTSIEPAHFPVFRDQAGETREEFWISAFTLALDKELPP